MTSQGRNRLRLSIYIYICIYIQSDQKVSVHLMITTQNVISNVQSVPRQSPDIYWQGQGDTRLTLTPPVITNSNYVIMVGDWNCLKYCIFECFLYCNRQVHRDSDHPVHIYIYIICIVFWWRTRMYRTFLLLLCRSAPAVSSNEFLLYYLKFTITAIVCLSPAIDC